MIIKSIRKISPTEFTKLESKLKIHDYHRNSMFFQKRFFFFWMEKILNIFQYIFEIRSARAWISFCRVWVWPEKRKWFRILQKTKNVKQIPSKKGRNVRTNFALCSSFIKVSLSKTCCWLNRWYIRTSLNIWTVTDAAQGCFRQMVCLRTT